MKVNHDRGGFCPLVLDEAKEENLGTAFSRCSLPKKGGRGAVGEMRWSGPWKAESGIHPDSRNNLLIFFKKETPSARWQDKGSSFPVSHISRFEGSSWWDQK